MSRAIISQRARWDSDHNYIAFSLSSREFAPLKKQFEKKNEATDMIAHGGLGLQPQRMHSSTNIFSSLISRRPQSACMAVASSRQTHSDTMQPLGALLPRFGQATAAALLATTLVFSPLQASALAAPQVDNAVPLLDLAKVMPSGQVESLQAQLRSLEEDTGYRVRVLTRYGPSDTPSIEDIRAGWNVDQKTIVVFVDPGSPNIMAFNFGLEIQKLLHRPFFTELQSRYGNMFYVRENGEQKAVSEMVNALDTCLRKEGGCRVPPGLPVEQYYFSLGTSIAGGLILGSVLRIDPQGFVQRRWVYGLLFAPLWATLSINFGIGPVVSRTDDPLPVVANVAATMAAAALIYWYPQAAKATGLTVDEPANSDWE